MDIDVSSELTMDGTTIPEKNKITTFDETKTINEKISDSERIKHILNAARCMTQPLHQYCEQGALCKDLDAFIGSFDISNPILTAVYETYLDIKDCEGTFYVKPLSNIIKGFTLLKSFESDLFKKTEIVNSYNYLSLARATFENVSIVSNHSIAPICTYLLLWGKGLCNLFYSFVTNSKEVKTSFLTMAKDYLLQAYHLFSISDDKTERFPLLNDPIMDMAPFYIGVTLHMLGQAHNAHIFVSLSLYEENLPEGLLETSTNF